MPSELLGARFNVYFIGYILLTPLTFVTSSFFSLYLLPLRSFFLSDLADNSCHLLLDNTLLWGTQPCPLLTIIWTTAALTAVCTETFNSSCPESCLCFICQDKFMPIAWGLPKQRRTWNLNLNDWKFWMF